MPQETCEAQAAVLSSLKYRWHCQQVGFGVMVQGGKVNTRSPDARHRSLAGYGLREHTRKEKRSNQAHVLSGKRDSPDARAKSILPMFYYVLLQVSPDNINLYEAAVSVSKSQRGSGQVNRQVGGGQDHPLTIEQSIPR